MTIQRLSRPPRELGSFQDRKWRDSLSRLSGQVSAISDLPFIVITPATAPSELPSSRRIVGSTNIELTDAGAGSSLTLDLTSTTVTPGSYTNATITVNSKGRLTFASSGAIPAASSEAYITIGNTSGLTAERALAVGSSLTLSDGGAGGSVTLSLNLSNANTWAADQSVPDEAYGVGWNGSLEVPTKNALYDKIETLSGGGVDLSNYTNHFLLGGL